METTFNIQTVSQQTDLKDPHWQYRGCGIAALKMIMNYWHAQDIENQSPSLDELLATGIRLGAYMENVGWLHKGLINVAREYGYDGYNVDEPNANKLELWQELLSDLVRQPIMVSVYSKFDPARGGGHIVVLAGVTAEHAIINDPEDTASEQVAKPIDVSTFLSAFKQRYIVISPKI